MAPICGICHQQESKYRCPKCDLRYCSIVCYKPHRADHESATEANLCEQQEPQPKRDRPGTTQRVPKLNFTGFESDKDFQQLLTRFALLRLQLGAIYGLTLEPGPEDSRTWNRQPLPGVKPPAQSYRGSFRGRGRGRGSRDARGGRHADNDWRDEREKGLWTREKGDREALNVMKKMRDDRDGGGEDAAEGMREFVELCRIKFGQQEGEGRGMN